MSESPNPTGAGQNQEELADTTEKGAPFGADKDQKGAEGMDAEMGEGGYAGRDPRTDMPKVPSVPETQEDPMGHDAAPDPDAPERNASE